MNIEKKEKLCKRLVIINMSFLIALYLLVWISNIGVAIKINEPLSISYLSLIVIYGGELVIAVLFSVASIKRRSMLIHALVTLMSNGLSIMLLAEIFIKLLSLVGIIEVSQLNDMDNGGVVDFVMTASSIVSILVFLFNVYICILNKKINDEIRNLERIRKQKELEMEQDCLQSNNGVSNSEVKPVLSEASLNDNDEEKKILIFIQKILENSSEESSAAELKQLRAILTEQKVSENIIGMLDAVIGSIPEAKLIAQDNMMSPENILVAKQRADARIAREREMELQYRGCR